MQTLLAREMWAYQLADIAVYEGSVLGPRVHAGLAQSYGLALYNSSSKLHFRILFMVCHTSLLVLSVPKPFVGLSLVSPQPTIRHWKKKRSFENLQSDAGKVQISVFSQVFLFAVTIYGMRTTGGTSFVPRCGWGDCTPHWTRESATGCGCRRCQHVMSSCSCAFVNILLFFAGLPCGGTYRRGLYSHNNIEFVKIVIVSLICPG